jgi:hypothetical protein
MTCVRVARCRQARVLIEQWETVVEEIAVHRRPDPGRMCNLVLKQLHDLHSLVDGGLNH